MSRGKSTPSRSFPRQLSVDTGRLVFGILLLLVSLGMYFQLSEMNVRDERTSQTNTALIQALTAEQESAVSKGEIPVAPAPSEIVKNPEVVIIKGDKGDKGDPGKNGTDGKNGKDGKDGKDAPAPSPLPPIPGEPGQDGMDGADGSPGDKGDKGDPGTPGEPPYGWTTYDSSGNVTGECKRVPENWDPERPQYECFAAAPEPTPSESGSVGE